MAWQIVRQPNGKLARWTDVVDDFTHCNMTEAEAAGMCIAEYGMSQASAWRKVAFGADDFTDPQFHSVHELKDDGLNRWRRCLRLIRQSHGDDTAREREAELSA